MLRTKIINIAVLKIKGCIFHDFDLNLASRNTTEKTERIISISRKTKK